jgi:hypothetical protein
MERGPLSLAFAYAANDAYAHADENWELIDAVLRDLRGQVAMGDAAFERLAARFFQVLETNRTAPAIVRIMAFAEELRVARSELTVATGWRARRAWRRHAARAADDLVREVAATLDGLLAEL